MTAAPARAMPTGWRDTRSGYGRLARLLHWLTAGLIAAAFALAWTWDLAGRGLLQAGMVHWHREIGAAILLVTVLRLGWRLLNPRPRHPDLPAWNRALIVIVQGLIYALLLAIPLLGWAYTNAGGLPVDLLSLPLPTLLPRDTYLAKLAVSAHEALATALLAGLGLHVAGAIWHRLTAPRASLPRPD